MTQSTKSCRLAYAGRRLRPSIVFGPRPFAVVLAMGTMLGSLAATFFNHRVGDRLFVDPKNLDLGDVWASGELDHVVNVLNPTSSTIDISSFHTSCRCTSVSPRAMSIPPHTSAAFHLSLDMTRTPSPSVATAASDMVIEVTALTGDTTPVGHWLFQARVYKPFVIRPDPIRFPPGELNTECKPFRPLMAQLVCNPNVESVALECDSRFVTANLDADAPGADTLRRHYRLTVIPRSDLPPGPFQQELGFTVVTAETTFRACPLLVSGTVVDDLQLTPPRLTFDAARIGDFVEQDIVVTSRTKQRFSVEPELSTIDGIDLQLISVAGFSDIHMLRVKQHVLNQGLSSNEVRLRVTRPDGGERIVPMVVTYRGCDLHSSSLPME